MSMFTLAILTTSNLPWFMDLMFQVPMQYCSLQFQTVLSPPDTPMTGRHFHFGPGSSFFLELLATTFHSSPVAHGQLPTWGAYLPVLHLLILFMGFLRQEYWSGLPLPPPVEHVLSELFTMTRPSWVALHSMADSFIELPKPVYHDKAVIYEEDLLWHQCN